MALDKYSKGLEVDAYGNVVGEKYDAQLKPGEHPIVPVVVDENATHEALKAVAAENPDLELDDGGHYIQVEQPAPLEGDLAGGDVDSGAGATTLRSPVMEKVLEQDAKNKEASAEAAEAQASDSEAEGADQQAEEARAAAERAEARAEQS